MSYDSTLGTYKKKSGSREVANDKLKLSLKISSSVTRKRGHQTLKMIRLPPI